jgi:hypothetical protein
MIDMSKKYRTRDGRDVRIYAVDAGGKYPVHGATLGLGATADWGLKTWTQSGDCYSEGSNSSHDLVEAKAEVWVWQYEDGTLSGVARTTDEKWDGLYCGRKGKPVRFVQEDEA